MDDILTTITQAVIIPVIITLGTLLVALIKAKSDEIQAKTKNTIVKSTLENVETLVSQMVTNTTQTYVSTLKSEGKFTAEAAKQAF